jgi:hypothetical protein
MKGGLPDDYIEETRKMTDALAAAFEDSGNFAGALRALVKQRDLQGVSEVAEELKGLASLKRTTGITTMLTDEAAAYVAAVRELARREGRGVVELHHKSDTLVVVTRTDVAGNPVGNPIELSANKGIIDDDDFMREVIAKGEAILDFAALTPNDGAHGALTHVLHDLVADKALRVAGFAGGSSAFRSRISEIQAHLRSVGKITDEEAVIQGVAQEVPAGTILWIGTYDRMRSLAQPETLWPPLLELLGLFQKQL